MRPERAGWASKEGLVRRNRRERCVGPCKLAQPAHLGERRDDVEVNQAHRLFFVCLRFAVWFEFISLLTTPFPPRFLRQGSADTPVQDRKPVEPVGAAGAMEDDMLVELVGQDYGMVRGRRATLSRRGRARSVLVPSGCLRRFVIGVLMLSVWLSSRPLCGAVHVDEKVSLLSHICCRSLALSRTRSRRSVVQIVSP